MTTPSPHDQANAAAAEAHSVEKTPGGVSTPALAASVGLALLGPAFFIGLLRGSDMQGAEIIPMIGFTFLALVIYFRNETPGAGKSVTPPGPWAWTLCAALASICIATMILMFVR